MKNVLNNLFSASNIQKRTEEVRIFLERHDDWFTNPENTFYGTDSLVSAFLMGYARTGVFPDDWNDSRLIYVEGKFREWRNNSSEDVWYFYMN